MKLHLVTAAISLIDAVVFGVLAVVFYRKKSAKLAACHRAWGVVVVVNERGGQDGTIRHPVIRFTAADGQCVAFESAFGSSNWKVKQGDRLEVFFNPEKPSEAEVVKFVVQWCLPLVFGIVAVASVVGAPILYLLLRA